MDMTERCEAIKVTSDDLVVFLRDASFDAGMSPSGSGTWFGDPVFCSSEILVTEEDRVPDDVLIWECEYCGEWLYEERPTRKCGCGSSRFRPKRLVVEDG
jgi:hypothetical protein